MEFIFKWRLFIYTQWTNNLHQSTVETQFAVQVTNRIGFAISDWVDTASKQA